jgi:hypothetical protein
MAAAKLTSTQTIRRLGQSAKASEDPAPGDEALLLLDEDADHIGVIVRIEDRDAAPSSELAEDTRVWIVWLLKMRGDDGRYMVAMVNRAGEMTEAQDVEVTDEIAETAVEFARECFEGVEFEIRRAKGLRLVTLVSGEPGLCVRCRTNEPAMTEGNLLLAPEGPVCSGCLNLSEQLSWGEAALAVLRKARASPEKISEVESQLESLRAEKRAGPS